MELRLAKFITAIERVTDIHNQDYSNPVLLDIPHPDKIEGEENQPGLAGKTFRMAAAMEEPIHLGLPFNAIWINLQPNSLYYRQALKLKSALPPGQSGIAGAITNDGYECTWVRITRYDQMFNEAQTMGEGPQGPQGPAGKRNIVHRGNWTPREYTKGEGVMFNGGFYVAEETTLQNPEDAPQSWQQLSAPGTLAPVDYDYIEEQVRNILYPQSGT